MWATWIGSDGSAEGLVDKGGAGVLVVCPGEEERELRAPAGRLCSSYGRDGGPDHSTRLAAGPPRRGPGRPGGAVHGQPVGPIGPARGPGGPAITAGCHHMAGPAYVGGAGPPGASAVDPLPLRAGVERTRRHPGQGGGTVAAGVSSAGRAHGPPGGGEIGASAGDGEVARRLVPDLMGCPPPAAALVAGLDRTRAADASRRLPVTSRSLVGVGAVPTQDRTKPRRVLRSMQQSRVLGGAVPHL